jgi:mannitol-1-/sugar-/sorbitol-6-phosphatase
MPTPPLFQFHGSAILFDMDGTLVDSMAHDERQWTRWAARYGFDPKPILKISHGRRTEETIREVAPHLATEEEFARFGEEELSDREGIRPIAGAAALLHTLPPGSWALVTSAPTRLARVRMQCAGLPLPAVVVSADDVKHGKPDPEGVLLAACRLGAEPAGCLVIEDTPAGIQAARAAGMTALGITTTYSCTELRSTHCIRDFTAMRIFHDGRLHVAVAELPHP